MGRRSRKKYQEQHYEQEEMPMRTPASQSPIKVLAIGLAVLLIVFALLNLLLGNFASASGTSSGNNYAVAGTNNQVAGNNNNQAAGGTLAPVVNGVQQVTITMQGNRYQPYPVRVKVGVPVRFTLDPSTVRGCYSTLVIPDLGVSGRGTIDFTPTKAGTFRMTCGMGMADGQIVVEDANGNAPAAVPSAAPARVAGGGCGLGGGCGCGG